MPLYAATIFLSAFLLFLVQPIIARQILPWFGGAASVWAVCLVFFQSVLLAGYAYADWSSRRMAPRTQAQIHIALLALSLLLLPIIPDARWKPGAEGGAAPALAILGLLGVTIGVQYFLLSATSPLLQAWYWRRYQHAVPYRLFALSNFASLLALLSYPVAIEPWLRSALQSYGWSTLYGVFAVLCACTAWSSARAAGENPAPAIATDSTPAPTPQQRITWIIYAGLGSCFLLAVTNHLTQNIASIPFLWLAPLALYLITFILCFDHPRWYVRPVYLVLLAAALPAMAWASDSLDLQLAAPLYAAGLFVCCMFCHGELYRLRPAPRYLTTFFLMIAIGGALGALLIGLAAPWLLKGYFELEITLLACALLLAWNALAMVDARRWMVAAAFAVAAVTAAFVIQNVTAYASGVRVMVRNFYGVVRTRDYPEPVPFRVMYHGAINHGGQLTAPDQRRKPSTYFGLTSGYGRAFESLPQTPRRVGVIGLGAGAIAAYARQGDRFRFYEIDPQVAAVAMLEFSYLKDSPAQIDVVLGDGRLSLEREPAQRFDLLAIDAFAGDSIPMHLLTREAMAVYVKHLAPGGVMVFQATNRFVSIAPVVERLASEHGMSAMMVNDDPDNTYSKGADYWLSATEQIIVTRNQALLGAPALKGLAEPLAINPKFRVWTDDYYNLLGVLKYEK
jgi:hypothetical protein